MNTSESASSITTKGISALSRLCEINKQFVTEGKVNSIIADIRAFFENAIPKTATVPITVLGKCITTLRELQADVSGLRSQLERLTRNDIFQMAAILKNHEDSFRCSSVEKGWQRKVVNGDLTLFENIEHVSERTGKESIGSSKMVLSVPIFNTIPRFVNSYRGRPYDYDLEVYKEDDSENTGDMLEMEHIKLAIYLALKHMERRSPVGEVILPGEWFLDLHSRNYMKVTKVTEFKVNGDMYKLEGRESKLLQKDAYTIPRSIFKAQNEKTPREKQLEHWNRMPLTTQFKLRFHRVEAMKA
jgi:hypothetical protein